MTALKAFADCDHLTFMEWLEALTDMMQSDEPGDMAPRTPRTVAALMYALVQAANEQREREGANS